MRQLVTQARLSLRAETVPGGAHTQKQPEHRPPAHNENTAPVDQGRGKRNRRPTAQIQTHTEEVAKSNARRAKKAGLPHVPPVALEDRPPSDLDDWDVAEQREQDEDPTANDSEEEDAGGMLFTQADNMFVDTQIDIAKPNPKPKKKQLNQPFDPSQPPTNSQHSSSPSPPHLHDILNHVRPSEPEHSASPLGPPPRHLAPSTGHNHSLPSSRMPTLNAFSPLPTSSSQHLVPSTRMPSSPVNPPRGRSSHTGVRRPREDSPSLAPEDLQPVTKVRKIDQHVEPKEHKSNCRGKPKVGDFEEEHQATLKLACLYYRTFISTEHAFPSDFDGDVWAREAWQLACKEYNVECAETSSARKVIRARGSQLRGELKNHVRPLVVTHYNLVVSHKRRDNDRTAELIERIMANNGLVYRDHEGRKGLFENPILPKALNAQWFANSHGAGVNFHLYYNPIPIGTMALVFSVIENCLHEWQSGVFKRLDFTEKAYKDVYEHHLASLKKWQAHAQGGAILSRMQQRLHDNARAHSGAHPIEEGQPPRITDDNFDAAVCEAEEDDSEALYQ